MFEWWGWRKEQQILQERLKSAENRVRSLNRDLTITYQTIRMYTQELRLAYAALRRKGKALKMLHKRHQAECRVVHDGYGVCHCKPTPRATDDQVTESDRGEAARCWCEPTTSMIGMDVWLAEVFASRLAAQRLTIERLARERDDLQDQLAEAAQKHLTALSQLAASQARVTELEKECAGLAAGSCEAPYGDDYGNKRCKTIDQLQATLAAQDAALTKPKELLGDPST